MHTKKLPKSERDFVCGSQYPPPGCTTLSAIVGRTVPSGFQTVRLLTHREIKQVAKGIAYYVSPSQRHRATRGEKAVKKIS